MPFAYLNAIEFTLGSKNKLNKDFKDHFPEYDYTKFEKKVGIKSRFVLDEDETSLQLAEKAIKKLIKSNSIEKNEIDFLIHCTQSPEYMIPTSSCILQDLCGLDENTGCLDINLGCSGYTYGLVLAKSLIESGNANKVILVTSDSYSKYIHPKDLINQLIFGDAATASLITNKGRNKINAFECGSSGKGWDKLIVRNNFFDVRKKKSEEKFYGKGNIYTDDHLFMDGPAIYEFSIKEIPGLINRVMEKNKLTVDQIHKFIPHQANAFLLKSICTFSNIGKEKLFLNLDNYGNTVSSTIPIALKEYSRSLTEKTVLNILLAGFGVGLSWSAGILNLKNKL
jgi:3-oxoacyl-[acyl-carrier-protein] synthase III